MKNKEEIRKELEGLSSPILSKLKERGDGFSTPENYFQALPDELWQRIQQEVPQKQAAPAPAPWWSPIREFFDSLLQPRYALAFAGVAAAIAVAIFLFRPSSTAETGQVLAGVSADEAAQYIADNIDDFDMAMLMEVAAVENEQTTEPSPANATGDEDSLDQYYEELIDELDLEDIEEML
ncbi:MAG: hypothetical protein HUU34_00650 [Saprospiraceae bacterium]|jgi:hypothetical protein|nr:hypothetical protein [Saprospiraceae bacterium]